MPEKPTVSPELTCELKKTSSLRKDVGEFDDIVEFVETLLRDTNLRGKFQVIPLSQTPGSSENKGLRITRVDEYGGVRFIVQLGGNDTSWQCRLVPPHGMDPTRLRNQLSLTLETRKRNPPQKRPNFVPAVIEAPPPPPPAPPIRQSRSYEDLETVALALADLFPLRGTQVASVLLVQTLTTKLNLDEAGARTAITVLVAKKFIELRGVEPDTTARVVTDSTLGTHLRTLDALKPPSTIGLTPPRPAAPPPVVRRQAKSQPEERRSPPPIARVVSSNANPRQAPPPQPQQPKSFTVQLEELEERSARFAEAQRFLRTSTETHNALKARRERAEAELATVAPELAKLEELRTEATKIVIDPDYSEANKKIDHIRKIIDSE